MQEQILAKQIELYAIDAGRIAREVGLAGRINIVLQTCFFAISGVLPRSEAIAKIKDGDRQDLRPARRRGRRAQPGGGRPGAGRAAPDRGARPGDVDRELPPVVPADAPEFVRTVTAEMMAGRGDDLPVSALPVDGTYPSGTAAYEKRNISDLVAVWDPDLCIQCGNCSFVCPHSVIRSSYYDSSLRDGARRSSGPPRWTPAACPGPLFTLQVYAEDCTGCGLCVEACPVSAPGDPDRKAINLREREPVVAAEREQHRVLRDAAGGRPVPGRLRHGPRHPVPAAAVRVLRRLRGLRRDARTSSCCRSCSATG